MDSVMQWVLVGLAVAIGGCLYGLGYAHGRLARLRALEADYAEARRMHEEYDRMLEDLTARAFEVYGGGANG